MKPQKQHLSEASKTLKSIKRRINEESLDGKPSDKVVELGKKLAKMIDNNYHVEAYYELAKFLGDSKRIKIMKALVDIQDAMGHLDHDLAKFRNQQFRDLHLYAKQNLKHADYHVIFNINM